MPLKVESLPPDCRGEIHRLDLNGVKVNLLFSRKGTWRGGDVHPNTQYGLVLSGAVEVRTRRGNPGRDHFNLHWAGELFCIRSHIPHLYSYKDDTVQLEWWDGPFEAMYYKPYRDIVEKSMREGAGNG